MTNAVENGSNPFGCSDYLSQRHRILNTGAETVEWMGGQSMHTKTILIDDSISVVGSFNLDVRSTYLDTELMLVIDCPALNQQLRSDFDSMVEQSRTVLPDGSETLGLRCESMELPLWKRYLYGVLRVVLQPVRHLL